MWVIVELLDFVERIYSRDLDGVLISQTTRDSLIQTWSWSRGWASPLWAHKPSEIKVHIRWLFVCLFVCSRREMFWMFNDDQNTTEQQVLRSLPQVEQATRDWTQMELTGTGSCDRFAVGGASDTSASYSELLVQSSKKTRDNCSLPSSPYPGGRRRLPCSMPCSPLLRGRHWRSSPIAPALSPGLSRLLVEAALQRSKNIRPSPPCSPQVRQEGQEEEDIEEEEQSDEDKVSTVKIVGIRLSDTVISRLLTSPDVCGREDEQQEEEQEEGSRYCLLTPCVCFRYENFL